MTISSIISPQRKCRLLPLAILDVFVASAPDKARYGVPTPEQKSFIRTEAIPLSTALHTWSKSHTYGLVRKRSEKTVRRRCQWSCSCRCHERRVAMWQCLCGSVSVAPEDNNRNSSLKSAHSRMIPLVSRELRSSTE